tara:strand:+ start:41006 stop:41737 length:732 start_codon:yes stop_codon:yes gene_type:complete
VSFIKFFKKTKYTKEADQELALYIEKTTGNIPKEIQLYHVALTHQSHSDRHGLEYNNERLEFLGDSVLDIVVSEYLYRGFPEKNEGNLTIIRSAIVNRKSLNKLALKIGLDKQLKTSVNLKQPGVSLPGNALEAFIGACYLDLGYKAVHKFIIEGLIEKYLDLNSLENEFENYKSTLLEWSQKADKKLEFKVETEPNSSPSAKSFSASVTIKGEDMRGNGKGRSKKIAEQNASLALLQKLGIK